MATSKRDFESLRVFLESQGLGYLFGKLSARGIAMADLIKDDGIRVHVYGVEITWRELLRIRSALPRVSAENQMTASALKRKSEVPLPPLIFESSATAMAKRRSISASALLPSATLPMQMPVMTSTATASLLPSTIPVFDCRKTESRDRLDELASVACIEDYKLKSRSSGDRMAPESKSGPLVDFRTPNARHKVLDPKSAETGMTHMIEMLLGSDDREKATAAAIDNEASGIRASVDICDDTYDRAQLRRSKSQTHDLSQLTQLSFYGKRPTSVSTSASSSVQRPTFFEPRTTSTAFSGSLADMYSMNGGSLNASGSGSLNPSVPASSVSTMAYSSLLPSGPPSIGRLPSDSLSVRGFGDSGLYDGSALLRHATTGSGMQDFSASMYVTPQPTVGCGMGMPALIRDQRRDGRQLRMRLNAAKSNASIIGNGTGLHFNQATSSGQMKSLLLAGRRTARRPHVSSRAIHAAALAQMGYGMDTVSTVSPHKRGAKPRRTLSSVVAAVSSADSRQMATGSNLVAGGRSMIGERLRLIPRFNAAQRGGGGVLQMLTDSRMANASDDRSLIVTVPTKKRSLGQQMETDTIRISKQFAEGRAVSSDLQNIGNLSLDSGFDSENYDGEEEDDSGDYESVTEKPTIHRSKRLAAAKKGRKKAIISKRRRLNEVGKNMTVGIGQTVVAFPNLMQSTKSRAPSGRRTHTAFLDLPPLSDGENDVDDDSGLSAPFSGKSSLTVSSAKSTSSSSLSGGSVFSKRMSKRTSKTKKTSARKMKKKKTKMKKKESQKQQKTKSEVAAVGSALSSDEKDEGTPFNRRRSQTQLERRIKRSTKHKRDRNVNILLVENN